MAERTLRTRFAPSPTGYLHLGNARTALFSALWARALEGRFILRIEDTDRFRSRAEYTDALIEDLRWLGLEWDEGPGGRDSPDAALYFQSERQGLYDALYERLLKAGHAYECYCSPEELEAERAAQRALARPPRYSGRCRSLSAAERARRRMDRVPSLRFAIAADAVVTFDDAIRGRQQFASSDIGDFVIRRSDGTAAFFFSNAVDDALMEVTHVLRGEDHLANTPRQLLVLDTLDLPRPQYAHVGLIAGTMENAPLSKRDGAASLREFRAQGWRPEALMNYMARLGGGAHGPELDTFAGLAAAFEVRALSRGPARHDALQMEHWQRVTLQGMDISGLEQWSHAVLEPVPAPARSAFLSAIRGNVLLPSDVQHWVAQIYGEPILTESARKTVADAGAGFFCEAARIFSQSHASPEAGWRALGAATGTRGKGLFAPLRAALTGQLDGPELAQLIPLITPDRLVQRLQVFCESPK